MHGSKWNITSSMFVEKKFKGGSRSAGVGATWAAAHQHNQAPDKSSALSVTVSNSETVSFCLFIPLLFCFRLLPASWPVSLLHCSSSASSPALCPSSCLPDFPYQPHVTFSQLCGFKPLPSLLLSTLIHRTINSPPSSINYSLTCVCTFPSAKVSYLAPAWTQQTQTPSAKPSLAMGQCQATTCFLNQGRGNLLCPHWSVNSEQESAAGSCSSFTPVSSCSISATQLTALSNTISYPPKRAKIDNLLELIKRAVLAMWKK